MNIHQRISNLIIDNARPFALCTVTETKGSTPRHSAKMIVFEDRSIEYTLGGGPAEYHTIEEAVKLIPKGGSHNLKWILDKEQVGGLPMTCGGSMTIHIEVYEQRPQLILLGAGHVNRAIIRMAQGLGYQIIVIDDRPVAFSEDLQDKVERIFCASTMREAIEMARPHLLSKSFYVIATKDNDEAALEALGEQEASYIGLIGSRRKVGLIRENLISRGMDPALLNRVEMPVGLDLGGETPEEIALSVLAQVQIKRYNATGKPMKKMAAPKPIILIRGGGDLATGIACRLFKAGHPVICTEITKPTAIRHSVSFSRAVYEQETEVEQVKAIHCESLDAVSSCLANGNIPVYTGDEQCLMAQFKPEIFIEATIRKVASDIHLSMAPLVIGVGPGFIAVEHVHCVVETMRGHDLGTVIRSGSAVANTGVPGEIGGYTTERVIKSPAAGLFIPHREIGDYVTKGECLGLVRAEADVEVLASIDGILRGILWENIEVTKGFKIADIDPRAKKSHCFTISDKARAIGGGVLEAVEHYLNTNIVQR